MAISFVIVVFFLSFRNEPKRWRSSMTFTDLIGDPDHAMKGSSTYLPNAKARSAAPLLPPPPLSTTTTTPTPSLLLPASRCRRHLSSQHLPTMTSRSSCLLLIHRHHHRPLSLSPRPRHRPVTSSSSSIIINCPSSSSSSSSCRHLPLSSPSSSSIVVLFHRCCLVVIFIIVHCRPRPSIHKCPPRPSISVILIHRCRRPCPSLLSSSSLELPIAALIVSVIVHYRCPSDLFDCCVLCSSSNNSSSSNSLPSSLLCHQ